MHFGILGKPLVAVFAVKVVAGNRGNFERELNTRFLVFQLIDLRFFMTKTEK